ncbi:hypothetical protein L6164_007302 [Bauhinia variegata]|uniref:Uncharacterized protein n=1 Tax=Bauhinia variegata TaxID=167791 RepID=A0ACB9PCF9_BAUVA|nr:hypothetical protein L6164_007302 [Bauhinia variegata]
MATEDFSFPTISDTHPYAIDSPPLWNLSPVGSPNPYQACSEGKRKKNRDKEDCFEGKFVTQSQRKSFSYIENRRRRFGEDEDDDEDDKDRMDMLWEDFNEELSSTTGSCTSSSREAAELSYSSSLKVANKTNNGALVSSKNRPGLVMLVKVMQKLFTLGNSQGKPRKRVR